MWLFHFTNSMPDPRPAAFTVALTLPQLLALAAVAVASIAALAGWAGWHIASASSYALPRAEWVCSKTKSTDRAVLWRGGYYFPSESARNGGCFEYSKIPAGNNSGDGK
jgi:hypothetical protein